MLYLAVSVVALVIAIPVFLAAESSLTKANGSSELLAFVAAVNSRTTYQSSSFFVYLPSSICDAEIDSRGVSYLGRNYTFNANVSANALYLCKNAGNILNLNLSEIANGTFVLT